MWSTPETPLNIRVSRQAKIDPKPSWVTTSVAPRNSLCVILNVPFRFAAEFLHERTCCSYPVYKASGLAIPIRRDIEIAAFPTLHKLIGYLLDLFEHLFFVAVPGLY